MKKITGFKKGYYIRIIDGFYEVIDGNRVIYYGECRKNSTIQEIANKTFLLNQEVEHDRGRIKSKIGTSREKGNRVRNQINAEQNVACV